MLSFSLVENSTIAWQKEEKNPKYYDLAGKILGTIFTSVKKISPQVPII